MIMIKLDDLRPIFIGLAMSFKILGSTASRPIFLQLIARPINLGWIYPILYHNQTSTFQKIIKILHFPPNLTSDDLWPWYMTFDLINIQRNPYCIFDPSLVVIGLQLFKGDPNNENKHFPPNLTSDDPWPWYVTLDLIKIRRNPYCIFEPSLL